MAITGLREFRPFVGTLEGFPHPPAMVRGEQSSPAPHAIRDAMKGLLFAAAIGVGLTVLAGDASAGLTAESPLSLSAVRGTARAGITVAKAKKKKRPAASGSSKSDSDDAAPADDDASGSKSSS